MAFDARKLKRFFDKPPLRPPYHINENCVFVAVDPNGGASASDAPGSDTAIVSFVVSHGRVVVSGCLSVCLSVSVHFCWSSASAAASST
jgi:hypothetical protein